MLAVSSIGFAQSKTKSSKQVTAQEKKDLFQLISKDNLLIEMLKRPWMKKVEEKIPQSMVIQKIDLNNDGKREYMIELGGEDFCGSAGNCLNWVYGKKSGEYNLLVSTNTRLLLLEKTSTNKFDDLSTEDRGGDFYTYNVVIYKFNGYKYEAKKCFDRVYAKYKLVKTIPTVCKEND
jgi:hypothetical protein